MRAFTAALTFGVTLGFAAQARAQALPSFDARTWRPAPDPGAQLVLEAPSTPGPWAWNVGFYASYALHPVTLRDADTGNVVSRPLEHLVENDYVAELGLGERAAIGLSFPVALYETGTASLPPTVLSTGSVPSSAIGDLAIHGKAAIIPIPEDKLAGFGLSVLGAVSLPTGDPASFLGEGSTAVSARALVEYKYLVARVQATLGYRLRTEHHAWPDRSIGGVEIGDEIPWSFAVGLKVGVISHVLDEDDRQRLELGFHGSLPAGPVGPFGSGDPGSARLTPVLLALSDRVEIGHYHDVYAVGGVDVGLNDAIGVPNVRFIASVGWAPRDHDEDHDGVPDDRDQCTPDMPEDRDHIQDDDGCPEDDADEDGVPDIQDACPLVAGAPQPDPTKNGCPAPDADGDGIADPTDACPTVKGDESANPRKNGCPRPEKPKPPPETLAAPPPSGSDDVTLEQPLVFVGTDAAPALDEASMAALGKLALAMNAHPTWTLGVGTRPADESDAARQAALAKAGAVVQVLNHLMQRTAAEVVTWDAVKALPGSASGVGIVILKKETAP